MSDEAYPYPSRMTHGFDAESDFRNWIASTLERFGWNAKKEVWSDCRTVRADIITEHEIWGKIGIECKFRDHTTSRDYAQAYKQIREYSQKEFGDERIDNWVAAVGEDYMVADSTQDERFERAESINFGGTFREFLNNLNVGTLRLERRLEFVFNNSNPMVKPPIADIEYPTGELTAPPIKRLNECDVYEVHSYLADNSPRDIV